VAAWIWFRHMDETEQTTRELDDEELERILQARQECPTGRFEELLRRRGLEYGEAVVDGGETWTQM
jgi:hypothetical protein